MKTEKIIDGKLCWKESFPEGEWIEYSREELTILIQELELQLDNNKNPYEKAPWWINPDVSKIDITC